MTLQDNLPTGRTEIEYRAERETRLNALREYWDRLNSHDWNYDRSDDHAVWLKGHVDETLLDRDASLSHGHAELMARFRIYGRMGGTKPVRP